MTTYQQVLPLHTLPVPLLVLKSTCTSKGRWKISGSPENTLDVASIEDASCTPKREDEFGEVKSVSIRLRGRLITLGCTEAWAPGLYYNDIIRVSLDDFLTTHAGRLYLIPLAPPRHRYWALLVSLKRGNETQAMAAYHRHRNRDGRSRRPAEDSSAQ